jgi:hypothetical protein
MRGFHNNSFDPQTLLFLETAFDEAWLTLKFFGNKTVKPDELARSVLRVAMEGERDPIRGDLAFMRCRTVSPKSPRPRRSKHFSEKTYPPSCGRA